MRPGRASAWTPASRLRLLAKSGCSFAEDFLAHVAGAQGELLGRVEVAHPAVDAASGSWCCLPCRDGPRRALVREISRPHFAICSASTRSPREQAMRQAGEALGEIGVLLAERQAADIEGLARRVPRPPFPCRAGSSGSARSLRLWAVSGCCSPRTWRRTLSTAGRAARPGCNCRGLRRAGRGR